MCTKEMYDYRWGCNLDLGLRNWMVGFFRCISFLVVVRRGGI